MARRPSRRRQPPPPPPSGSKLPLILAACGVGLALIIGLVVMLSGNGESTDEDVAQRPPVAKSEPKPTVEEPTAEEPSDPEPPPREDPAKARRKKLQATIDRYRTRVQDAVKAGELNEAASALDVLKADIAALPADDPAHEIVVALGRDIARLATELLRKEKKAIEELIAAGSLDEASQLIDALRDKLPEGRYDDDLDALDQKLGAARSTIRPPTKRVVLSYTEMGDRCDKLISAKRWRQALLYLHKMIELKPRQPNLHSRKALCYMSLNDWEKGYRAALKFLEIGTQTGRPMSYVYRMLSNAARVPPISDFELARKHLDSAIATSPEWLTPRGDLADLLSIQGKDAEAVAMLDKLRARAVAEKNAYIVALRANSLIYLGRYDEAQADIRQARELEKVRRLGIEHTIDGLEAWLHMEARGKKPGYSLEKARELLRAGLAASDGACQMHYAIWLYHKQRWADCARQFESLPPGNYALTPDNPYYHGISLLQLGYPSRAHDRLVRACRMKPSLKDTLRDIPGIESIIGRVLRDLGDFGQGGDLGTRVRVSEDHVTIARAMRDADALVIANRFSQAVTDYRSLLTDVKAASLRFRLQGRVEYADGYVELLDKLIAAIKGGALAGKQVPWGADRKAKLLAVDREQLRIGIGGGTATIRWPMMSFELLRGLLDRLVLTPRERFLLGTLAWRHGRADRAHALLISACRDVSLKKHVYGFLSDATGRTDQQWVVRGKRLISTSDKARLKKGLIRHEGRWITARERDRLQKGERKQGDKWVKLSEEELRARGLVKRDGRWIRRADAERAQGGWSGALTRETEHFRLQTDRGKRFLDDLARLMESAHDRMSKLVGAELPAGKKLTVLAFKRRSDYVAYLGRFESPAHAAAAKVSGMSRSEPATCCAYDRYSDRTRFLRALASRAASLHAREVLGAHAPGWLVRGLGGRLEGVRVTPKKVIWDGLPRHHEQYVRRAVRYKQLLPMDRLLTLREADIQDTKTRLAFAAQSWALVHFFEQTIDEALEKRLGEYLGHLRGAGKQGLKQFLGGDYGFFETAFEFFLEDL